MGAAVAEPGASAAAVRERLGEAMAQYELLADEVNVVADDPFAFFERQSRMAALKAATEAAAGLVGLALIRHVTSGGHIALDPPAPLADEPPARATVSESDIQQFTNHLALPPAPALKAKAAPAPHVWLQGLLRRLGVPRVPANDAELIEDVERLEHMTGEGELEEWDRLPSPMHVMLIELMVAWVRGLQERCPGSVVRPERADELFRTLAEHRRRTQPGFVFGLKLDHRPLKSTWFESAAARYEELHSYAFDPQPSFARTQAPARSSVKSGHTGSSEARKAEAVTVGAELKVRTAGKRAAIVGGNLRSQRRDALMHAFSFSELEWIETEHPAAVERLAQRVRAGTVDLVIALRFRRHRDSEKLADACSAARVPLAQPFGYGLRQVAEAVAGALAGWG